MSNRLRRRVLDSSVLTKLLEAPDLARRLQTLPASVLREALVEIGIEDAGELIALTTFEQLRDVFDEDLWRSSSPGADTGFESERFALWLEVLREAGDAFVANRLAEFSEEFLHFAFSQLVRVIDVPRTTDAISDADEANLLDKLVDSCSCEELDGYLVVARSEHAWDAVWPCLIALYEHHPELLRGLLRRNWIATASDAEDAGGLTTLLTESEELRADAEAEREDRRAERGYVSPADARAFLALARRDSASPEQDPITRAYFRALAPPARDNGPLGDEPGSRGVAWLQQLALRAGDTEVVETTEDESTMPETATRDSLFLRSVAELAERNPRAHQRILEELAFLANVLVAGDGSVRHAWRPVEAALHVVELCGAGLRAALDRGRSGESKAPADVLARWGAAGLFRIAWGESHSAAATSRQKRPATKPML